MQQKVAIITGVSSGLGKAAALKFKQEGIIVAGVSRTRPDIDIDLWIKADVTKKKDRKHILEKIERKFGRADILVNNAGKGAYATWEELPEDDLQEVFELNFFALVALTKKILPLLKKSHGTVINIASVAGKVHVPCMGAYCATKFAVCAFSDSLRPEVKKYGVKVLNVMPGRINTGFSGRSTGGRVPPETAGSGVKAEVFAEKLYTSWKSGRKSLVFPWWYRIFIFGVKLIPDYYDNKNIQLWKLNE